MATRQQITQKLQDFESLLDKESSDNAYTEFLKLAAEIVELMDSFEKSLKFTKQVRDAQKAYFKARRSGQSYEASKLLPESQKLESDLDKAVDNWLKKLAPPPAQQSLF